MDIKRIRRIISAALAAVMLICTPLTAPRAAIVQGQSPTARDSYKESGLLYTLLGDGTYEVQYDYNGAKPTGVLTIPAQANGVAVTRIAAAGFSGCDRITNVVLPDSVISAGENAFLGTPFQENQTGDIKYAGKIAIYCEEEATDVTVKSGTLGLADKLFHLTPDLRTAALPDSLVNLGFMAFDSCDKLTSVNIPSRVTEIDSGAFYGCSSLKKITLPSGVTRIGDYAFAGSGITSVSIPAGVTYIGKGAFENCASLSASGVKTANSGYADIGGRAFFGTPFLNSQSGVAYLGSVAIGADSNITSAVLKEGTTAIADMAFAGCEKLQSVTIPAGVRTIGEDAFFACSSLKSAVIPEGVSEIREDAFRLCSSLSGVSIPRSVKVIGEGAFYGADSLKNVSYGGSVYGWILLELGAENEPLLKPAPSIAEQPFEPAAPTELKADRASDNSLRLTWLPDAWADSYSVSVYSGGKWQTVGTTEEAYYKVNGLSANTEYRFRVTPFARNVAGKAAEISAATTSYISAPDKVSGFSGYPTSTGVFLNWDKNEYADSYQVDIYKAGKWVRLCKTDSNSVTSYAVEGLSPCTEYTFRIFAFCGSVFSSAEKINVITNAAPLNMPRTVTGLRTVSNDSEVVLSWDRTSTAEYYEVNILRNGRWVFVEKTSECSCTVGGLAPDTEYEFKVFSFRGSKFSPSAQITAKTTASGRPQPVTGLKASSAPTSVTLSWNASPGADSYQVDIYRNGGWVYVERLRECSCTVGGLTPETTYEFRVFAFKGANYSPSAKLTAGTSKGGLAAIKPTAPANFKAVSAAAESVTLSWSRTENADSYQVDVYKNGRWTYAAKLTETVCTVGGLEPGTEYQFRVFAFRDTYYSVPSKLTASTKALAGRPETVTGLTAKPAANSITLSWNKTASADSYEVDMYKDGKWTYVAKITSNSYKVNGLSASTEYRFRVFSFSGSLYSPSAKLTVSTTAAVSAKPASVSGLRGSASSDAVTLAWNKTATADSYEVDMYKNGKWTFAAKTAGTTCTITGLLPDTPYQFKVFSFKGSEYSPSAGISVTTAAAAEAPLTVTGLRAETAADSIRLSWDKTDTADEYEIDVKRNGKWTYVGKTPDGSFEMTGLSPETSYDIRVFSLRADNYSPSAKLTVTTSAEVRTAATRESMDVIDPDAPKPPVNAARVKKKGIDVSGWQGAVDFKKIKLQGIDFVIVKAGYETTVTQTWEENYSKARRCGLDVGAYWYSYALDADDAVLEALAFMDAMKGKRFDFPVFYDMEESDQFEQGKAVCTQLTEAFCGTLEKAGYCAGVYCSKHWYTAYVYDDARMKRPNWIAQYYDRCYYTGAFGMWQYGYEPIDGVESAECDVNFAYYDYAEYIRKYELSGNVLPRGNFYINGGVSI